MDPRIGPIKNTTSPTSGRTNVVVTEVASSGASPALEPSVDVEDLTTWIEEPWMLAKSILRWLGIEQK